MPRRLTSIIAFLFLFGNCANSAVTYLGASGTMGTVADLAHAISILNAQTSTTGGTIYLPAGVTEVSSPVALSAGQILQGHGAGDSVLKATAAMNALDVIEIQGNGASLRDVTIDRDLPTLPADLKGSGVDLNGFQDVVLEHVNIYRQSNGIQTSSANSPEGFCFDGGSVKFCTNYFLYTTYGGLAGISSFQVHKVAFAYSKYGGLYLVPGVGESGDKGRPPFVVRDCSITAVADFRAIHLNDNGFRGTYRALNMVTIDRVDIDHVRGFGLYSAGANLTVSNCNITEVGLDVSGPAVGGAFDETGWMIGTNYLPDSSGIFITSGYYIGYNNVQLLNNTIGNCSTAGIEIYGGGSAYPCNNMRIANNTLCNNGQYSSTDAAGIRIGHSIPKANGVYDHFTIVNNRAYNNAYSSPNACQRYGLLVRPGVNLSHCVIANNDFSDAAHTASIAGITGYIGEGQNF